MKIAVFFDNLGPYHVARMASLGARCDLLVIEQNAASSEYDWDSVQEVPFKRLTLQSGEAVGQSQSVGISHRGIVAALSEFSPDVIAVPGWASTQAISAVIWAQSSCVPIIVMSDSQEIDFPRTYVGELVKRIFITGCDGGFVAGRTHRDYLTKLGIDFDRVRLGYDVVDNNYFYTQAGIVRENSAAVRKEKDLPARYFLVSARFIEKKNLFRLLEAFKIFRDRMCSQEGSDGDWSLVVIGDGVLRTPLEMAVHDLGMTKSVFMPGFKQYSEIPAYYALAEAFILPSTTEQWGLVVNEAMASGLPVLVSERAGSAGDLVQSGFNGYTFDPYNVVHLSDLMVRLAIDRDAREAMGTASSDLIKEWSPDVFSKRLLELAAVVTEKPKRKPSFLFEIFLRAMLFRFSRMV